MNFSKQINTICTRKSTYLRWKQSTDVWQVIMCGARVTWFFVQWRTFKRFQNEPKSTVFYALTSYPNVKYTQRILSVLFISIFLVLPLCFVYFVRFSSNSVISSVFTVNYFVFFVIIVVSFPIPSYSLNDDSLKTVRLIASMKTIFSFENRIWWVLN